MDLSTVKSRIRSLVDDPDASYANDGFLLLLVNQKCGKIPRVNLGEILGKPELTELEFFWAYDLGLKQKFPGAKIKPYPPEKFEVTLPGREAFIVFLKDLWRKMSGQSLDVRVYFLVNHLNSIQPMLAATKVAPTRENIVPTIKNSEFVSQIGDLTDVPQEHLAADIWIIYALDLPNETRSFRRSDLQQLGVDPGELRQLACNNLDRILTTIRGHGRGPWYAITAGGNYEASILLLDKVWEEWQDWEELVDGDIVAAVPARDVLLVTGSRSKEGIQTVRQKARQIEEKGDHLISQTLLRRTSGTWKVFERVG